MIASLQFQTTENIKKKNNDFEGILLISNAVKYYIVKSTYRTYPINT